MPTTQPPRPRATERALLIAARRPDETDEALAVRCVEMARLAHTVGITVVEQEIRRRPPSPQTFLGTGRLQELSRRVTPDDREPGVDLVLVDDALTPRQQAALERALAVPVLDRPAVILEIFARHAGTRQAQLEVELARLRYQLPRVRELRADDAKRGGGGRGERGHTGVELEKVRIRDQITRIERELADHASRARTRQARRADVFLAALVGYTNAGKSTLMEALSGSEAGAEDKLFATLGTRVRQVLPPATPPVLVSDTVGFIRDLPHELVASFRSTLDEALAADLLLVVVDAADPGWPDQLAVTRETLDVIGAGSLPMRLVLTQADRLTEEERAALAEAHADALVVSAVEEGGVRRVRDALIEARDLGLCEETVVVPYADGARLAAIHAGAQVLSEEAQADGMVVTVRANEVALDAWHPEEDAPLDRADDVVAEAARLGLQVEADGPFDDSGLDSRVLPCVDEEGRPWILRAPRRPDVFLASRVEGRGLRLVRDRLPVAVPDWRVHAPRLTAYPRLPGTPGWTVDEAGMRWNGLDPSAPADAFLGSVARFLAALQGVPESAARAARLPVHTIDEVRARCLARIEETRDALGASEAQEARWRCWIDDDGCWPSHAALIHGDLHPGHLLLDEGLAVVSVLDWTEIAVDDPARDFAVIFGCFGPEVLDRLLARFGDAGGRTWPRMAEHVAAWWAFHAVEAARWALRHDDDAVLAHARSLVGT